MKKIRKNVFETNSSSTHSIAIPKHTDCNYPNVIHFGIEQYGWGLADDNDPASYLYTALLDRYSNDNDTLEEKLNFIKSILDSNDIRYTFEEPKWDFWGEDNYRSLKHGYVDHVNKLDGFFEYLFSSETKLLDFIFFGIVITGNDQGDDPLGYKYRTDKTVCDTDEETWEEKEVPNPYYDPKYEEYDWYYKGN